MSYCYEGLKDYEPMNQEQIKKAHTRQLLKELRSTYAWGRYSWDDCEWDQLHHYRQMLQKELATREHIPSKQESKRNRKERIKRGV